MMARSRIKLFDYQETLIKEVMEHLDKNTPRVCLAAAPGGGKTEMAIEIIRRYLERNPQGRVLILPHGTRVLDRNFVERLSGDVGFRWAPYRPKSDSGHIPFENIKAPVIVALPQSIVRVNDLGTFDLVLVDEAHERFDQKESNQILEKVRPRTVVLLTGTPSKFIADGTPLVAISSAELLDSGRLADPLLMFTSSTYRLSYERDYNKDGDVKESVEFSSRETNSTLKNLLSDLNKLGPLGKTLIACRSINQAIQTHKFLRKKHPELGALLSHSDPERQGYDPDSNAFTEFGLGPSKILTIVQRGILGFNMESLQTVIDMTGSLNPNRLFQLASRVSRMSPTVKRKRFVKVSPKGLERCTEMIMSVVMQLAADETFYKTWNGKLSESTRVFFERQDSPGDDSHGPSGKVRRKYVDRQLVRFDGWRDMSRIMKDASGVYRGASYAEARSILLGVKEQNPEKFKALCLELLRSTGGTITQKHPYYVRFSSYVGHAHDSFDPEFRKQCENLGWNGDVTQPYKKAILGHMRSTGGTITKKHPYYARFSSYVRRSDDSFDPEFRKQCEDLGWNGDVTQPYKKAILDHLRSTGGTIAGHCYYKRFYRYTCRKHNNFDPEFRKQCEDLGWNGDVTQPYKKAILDHLRSTGGTITIEHPYYTRFSRYTRPSNKDHEFRKQCEKLGWRRRDTQPYKEALLDHLKGTGGIITSDHPYYKRFENYTSLSNNAFDPEFRKQCEVLGWKGRTKKAAQ